MPGSVDRGGSRMARAHWRRAVLVMVLTLFAFACTSDGKKLNVLVSHVHGHDAQRVLTVQL